MAIAQESPAARARRSTNNLKTPAAAARRSQAPTTTTTSTSSSIDSLATTKDDLKLQQQRLLSLIRAAPLPATPARTSTRNPRSATVVDAASKSLKSPARPRSLAHLPSELLILVLEACHTSVLLKTRRLSHRWNTLACGVLARRQQAPVRMLADSVHSLTASYRNLSQLKAPFLDHYRQFLINIPSSDITEATWYSSPPQELQTVCECLCILRGVAPLPSSSSTPSLPLAGPDRFAMSWPVIKRTMGRYDFKSWFVGLQDNVTSIRFEDVRRVEDIIRNDPTITYERLREVSLAGYKLLIIVAACLQYANIFEEIETRRVELGVFERKYDRSRKFLAAVGGTHLLPPLTSNL